MEFLLLLVVLLCAALALTLPWQGVLRVAAILVFAITLSILLTPPVHWSDRGMIHIPLGAMLSLLFGPAAMALILRLVYRLAKGRSVKIESRSLDTVILLLAGVVLGLWLFLRLAWWAGGSDHAIAVHAATFAFAAGLGALAYQRPGAVRAFAASLALVTAALSFWSAAIHPVTVRSAAEAAADGRRFCIALQQRNRAAGGWADLTFLTMDKMIYRRHAVLVIEGEAENDARHWSFHRREFLLRGGPLTATRCDPET